MYLQNNLNSSIQIENHSSQSNLNINNYQNLMMDSLLLRSNSDSFNIDRNYIKSQSFFNEMGVTRERVLSFTSGAVNNSCQQKSKNTKSFLNQIKTQADHKSLTDNFHLHNKYEKISSRLKEINTTPERILDAPQLLDDYYLNLLDWSQDNILSVALGNSVYLWNGNTLETIQLMTSQDNICSLNWMDKGNCLAVGMMNGSIQLWDTAKMQQIREMEGHSARVCSLSWNSYLLSSGSKDSKIINHDVRVKTHIVSTLIGHSQEVCALKWSPDGSLLASGGNDNLLCIWDINSNSRRSFTQTNNNNIINTDFNQNNDRYNNNQSNNNFDNFGNFLNNNMNIDNNFSTNNIINNITNNNNSNLLNRNSMSSSSIWNIIEENDENLHYSNLNNNDMNISNDSNQINPKFTFTHHTSAVKALAWCPWQKGVLASGAGSKDKTIKFWNIDNGSLIKSIDSGSQVCALLWNQNEKELISSHGYSKHQISIWKYPQMNKIIELNGHMSRVLYLAMSPDGCSIASGAGDETLRFWKIGESKKDKNEENPILNKIQIR